MMLIDGLQLSLVVGFVVVWLSCRRPTRRQILAAFALAIVATAIWGIVIDRWQVGGGLVFGTLALLSVGWSRWRPTPAAQARLPWISGAAWIVLAILLMLPVYLFPVSALPRPSGPHAVGVRTFEIDDASRKGLFGVPTNAPRRLLVRVWYPAGDITGRNLRPYFTRAEAGTTGRALGKLFGFPPLFTHLRYVSTNAYESAPLLPGARRLPALIYSHGMTLFLGQHSALMENLASHGYLVFAVQHPRDAADTFYPNGDVIPLDPALPLGAKPDKAQVAAIAGTSPGERLGGLIDGRAQALLRDDRIAVRSTREWVRDRMFVHDRLERGRVPADVAAIVAAGRFDRVGEFGMSFGGATTGAVCLVDRRCAAGINMDGVDLALIGVNREMPVPFMMFHSELANLYRAVGATPPAITRSYNAFSYEHLETLGKRSDIYRFELAGAQHLGISDLALFVRSPLRGLFFGSASSDNLMSAQNEFVLGFFDRHLLSRDNSFPNASLARWHGSVTPVDVNDAISWWQRLNRAEKDGILDQIDRLEGD